MTWERLAFHLLLYLMTSSMFKRLCWYKWQVLFKGHRLAIEVLHCLIAVKTWPTVHQKRSYDVILCNRAFENHHTRSEIQESPTFYQVCKRPLNDFANLRHLSIPSRFLRSWARIPVSSKKQKRLGISWIPIQWIDASIILYNVMIIDFSWRWWRHNFLKLSYQTTHGQHVWIMAVPRYWSEHTGKETVRCHNRLKLYAMRSFVATVEKLLKEWRSARLSQCTVNKTPHSVYHTALRKYSFSVVSHSMLKNWRIIQVLEWQSVESMNHSLDRRRNFHCTGTN